MQHGHVLVCISPLVVPKHAQSGTGSFPCIQTLFTVSLSINRLLTSKDIWMSLVLALSIIHGSLARELADCRLNALEAEGLEGGMSISA